jgi:hypothetical protein
VTLRLSILLLLVAGCGDDKPTNQDFSAIADAAVDQALPAAITLGQALTLTSCLAVDANGIYYTDPGAPVAGVDAGATSRVMKLPLAGGTPTMLATNADTPGCVVLDSGTVYYTSGDKIYKVATSGGAAVLVSANQHVLPLRTPRIAVGNGFVYWVSDVYGAVDAYNGKNALLRVPVGGGTPEVVFNDLVGEPGGLAVNAMNAYYSDGSGMYLRALSGGAATAVGTSALHNNRFAIDGMHLVVAEVAGVGMGDVALFNLDGSGRTLLSMKLATSLAVDGSGVYGNLDGKLTRFSLDGKSATTLTEVAPRAIALDSANVYFADGASILKIAK